MKTIKHPYEVLIRGNQENHVVAAHVIYAVTIIHDDGSIQVAPGKPEACSPDNLADVLDPLIAEPLTQIQAVRDEVEATIKGLEGDLRKSEDDLRDAMDQASKAIQARDAEINNLRGQILTLMGKH